MPDIYSGSQLVIAWYDSDDTSGTNDRVYIENYDDLGGISLLGLIILARVSVFWCISFFRVRSRRRQSRLRTRIDCCDSYKTYSSQGVNGALLPAQLKEASAYAVLLQLSNLIAKAKELLPSLLLYV